MNRLKKIVLSAAAAASMLLTGCVSDMPSDITLDELEQKMARAMDPQGEYRKARAYFQRQNVTEEGLFSTKHQLVEVKFQRPDKFKFSFYEKNRVATEVLSIGNRAWMISYKDGTITPIRGIALEKIRIMLAMGHPDTDYDKLFGKTELTLTELDDGTVCYKLVCYPSLENSNPIIIYVDQATMLPRRMELTVKTVNGDIETVSEITEYKQFGKLNLPALTTTREGSREYSTRIVDYRINTTFEPDEFKLPEFDPVLIESQKRQRHR